MAMEHVAGVGCGSSCVLVLGYPEQTAKLVGRGTKFKGCEFPSTTNRLHQQDYSYKQAPPFARATDY